MLFWLDAMKILRRVATARGLRDEDELLVVLGKKAHEFTVRDALVMMQKEVKDLEVHLDVYQELIYRPGKGYQPCNNLLKSYLQVSLGLFRYKFITFFPSSPYSCIFKDSLFLKLYAGRVFCVGFGGGGGVREARHHCNSC